MIYFTADTHFHHRAIIDLCKRDVPVFGWMNRHEATDAMNKVLIERWNERIKKDDEVYFLGDLAFCGRDKAIAILEQLNGVKYWIRGNHDYDLAKKDGVSVFFEWVRDLYTLRVHDKDENDTQYHQPIVLCHYPLLTWDGAAHGTWHLHGHCHGSLFQTQGSRLDVGVDTHNLYPYSYQEVKDFMKTREFVKIDHHGKEIADGNVQAG